MSNPTRRRQGFPIPSPSATMVATERSVAVVFTAIKDGVQRMFPSSSTGGVATAMLLMVFATPAAAADVAVFTGETQPDGKQVLGILTGKARARGLGEVAGGNDGRGIYWVEEKKGEGSSSPGATPSGERAAEPRPGVAMPVNFDRGSSLVTDESIPYIAAVAEAMKLDASLRLTVEGHTDSTGDPGRNLVLSWERAVTVYKMLVSRYQIDPQRLRPEGKGIMEPLSGTEPNAAINRRVQFRPIR
jgi:outer membrane protein OmpA-like peptidoglycan-associated protein